MQLNLILNAVSQERRIVFMQMSAPKKDIRSVRMLLQGDPVIRSDMLYVCDADFFYNLRSEQCRGRSFLVLGAEPEHVICRSDDQMNLILLPESTDIPHIYNLVNDKVLVQNQVSCDLVKMTNALFSNKGIQHIADTAYAFLRNPIFVSDSSGRYLANVYDEDSIELGSSFEGFIMSDILYQHIDEGGKDVINSMGLEDILAHSTRPYRTMHTAFQKEAMFSNIRVHGVTVGRAFTVAMEHDFTVWDEEYFSHLITLLGQEMRKNESLAQNQYESESLALINLLTNSYADEEVFARSLVTFRLSKSVYFRVAVADALQPVNAETLSTLLLEFKAAVPTVPAAILGGHIVALLYYPDERGVSDYLSRTITDFASRSSLVFGVSNLFQSYKKMRSAYSQALRATYLGLDFSGGNPISLFSDKAALEVLTSYNWVKDAAEVIHPSIAAMRSHDEQYGTEYLKTLEVYLDVMCNSVAAASRLHIHKNTLLYRINKIAETFQIDLTQGEAVLNYQLSIRVLKILEGLTDLTKRNRDSIFSKSEYNKYEYNSR